MNHLRFRLTTFVSDYPPSLLVKHLRCWWTAFVSDWQELETMVLLDCLQSLSILFLYLFFLFYLELGLFFVFFSFVINLEPSESAGIVFWNQCVALVWLLFLESHEVNFFSLVLIHYIISPAASASDRGGKVNAFFNEKLIVDPQCIIFNNSWSIILLTFIKIRRVFK